MLFSFIRHTYMWRVVAISLVALLVSCTFADNEQGVIAKVNGHPIYFADADAQRNIFFGGLDASGAPPPDAVLTGEYAYALRQLIEQELVRQYLEKNKMLPTKAMLEEELDIVKNEYGPEFSNILLEDGISPDLWEKAIYRQLVVKHFVDKVLKQKIVFTQDEMEEYYKAHVKDFIVPEQWHFMELRGREQSSIEKAQKAIIKGTNATIIQQDFNVTVRDIIMGTDRLPESVVKEIGTLEPKKAGHIVKSPQGYRSILLLEKLPEQPLGTVETYKRIESALLEDRIEGAYTSWIQRRMSKASIVIAKSLKNAEPLEKLVLKENVNVPLKGKNSTKGVSRYRDISQD